MMAVIAQTTLPTARAIRWLPLAGVGGLLLAAGLLTRSSARPADPVLAIAAASLAATVVAGMRDPAAALLAPMPVSLMRRRLVRLSLVGAAALGMWWCLTALTLSPAGVEPGQLLALSATGVAVATWAPPSRAVSVGASVPVAWFVLDRVLPVSGVVADVLAWWRTDPWPIVAAAVLLCFVGRHR